MTNLNRMVMPNTCLHWRSSGNESFVQDDGDSSVEFMEIIHTLEVKSPYSSKVDLFSELLRYVVIKGLLLRRRWNKVYCSQQP
jgi:hypothetical protein